MDKRQKISMGKRITVIRCCIVLALVLLIGKSVQVQIFQGKDLLQKAEQSYSKFITIKGDRGELLDCHLNKLGTSIDAPNITADPSQVTQVKTVAAAISKVLDLPAGPLAAKLAQKGRYVLLARRVSQEQADEIRRMNLTGIYFEADSKRFYPNRSLAAQVIGFTGGDDKGLEGLEFKLNDILEGNETRFKVKRDGAGRILDIDKKNRDQLRGNSVVLTIDKRIQFLTENALDQAVDEFGAKSGIALVMRPSTGELLAVAHSPAFNPNNFSASERWTYRDRAVTDAFEPGSIMKVFTVAAAVEKGISPNAIYYCENGNYRVGAYTVHDTHDHQWLSMGQIVKFSSNIGATKISEIIGKQTMSHYLASFGFGRETGIECPGESAGTLRPYRQWSSIDTAAISFGQGISVTALQLVSAISAIANDGKLMKPMLVKKILSNTGRQIKVFRPTVARQVVSKKTARTIKQMMRSVVEEEGTGTRAAMDGYDVCGKTSTAQKADTKGGGYAEHKYIAAFAGFAPSDTPELATLVVVNEPHKSHYGGIVAAPAFKIIMEKSFSYLNIPPSEDRTMVAAVRKEVTP